MKSDVEPLGKRTILDFKAEPKYVLPSLKIISANAGNWHRIRAELLASARSLGSDAKEGNVVSAYVTPTLRNLRLASGKYSSLKLTSDGTRCLRAYEQSGESGFRKRLGLQLIRVDAADGGLFEYLLKKHSSVPSAVRVERLKEELFVHGHPEAKSGTRVQSWISFLRYVDLIRTVSSRISAMSYQYRAIIRGEKIPSDRKFVTGLKSAYAHLRAMGQGGGSPYVPIPVLRDATSDDLGITTFTFDNKLKNAVASSNVRIVLSTPMRRKEGGIIIGKKYYYFAAVYP